MKRIRIKKEIALVWAVTTNGHEEPLAGRNLSLFLVDPKYRKTAKTFHIENGNEVHFRVYPSEQPFTGVYTLELWENLGGQDQTVVDKRSAFELVNFTPQECDGSVDDIHAAEVFIGSGNLAVGIHGRGIVSVTKVSEDPNDWDYRILYDDGATEIIKIARGEKGLTDEEHADLIAETLAAKSAAQSANLAATLAASKAQEAAEKAQEASDAAESANAAKEAADEATEAAQAATTAANLAKQAADNAATLATNAGATANAKASAAQAAADAAASATSAAQSATTAATAATNAANAATQAATDGAANANSKATLANTAAQTANAAAQAAQAAKTAADAATIAAQNAAANAEEAASTIDSKIGDLQSKVTDLQRDFGKYAALPSVTLTALQAGKRINSNGEFVADAAWNIGRLGAVSVGNTYELKMGDASKMVLGTALFVAHTIEKRGNNDVDVYTPLFSAMTTEIPASGYVCFEAMEAYEDVLVCYRTDVAGATELLVRRYGTKASIATQINNLKKKVDLKSFADGYYAGMRVGTADNLTPRGEASEETFMERVAGGTHAIEDGDAAIKAIKGKTLKVVQKVKVVNPSLTRFGITIDGNADGSIRVHGTSTAAIAATHYFGTFQSFNIPAGHKVLLKLVPKNSPLTACVIGLNYSGGFYYDRERPTLYTLPYGASLVSYMIDEGVTIDETFFPQVFDLTDMFGAGNEPTSVQAFAEALGYPSIDAVPYFAYTEGKLVPSKVEGVKTTGRNLWDEEWESGYWDTNGNKVERDGRIRSKNLIKVQGGTKYNFHFGGFRSGLHEVVYFYDASLKEAGRIYPGIDMVVTAPTNAVWCAFFLYDDNAAIASYNHDICINISDASFNGQYEPYEVHERKWGETLRKYFPDGLNAEKSAYDELTPTKAIKRTNMVNMNELNWKRGQFGSIYAFYAPATGMTYARAISSKYNEAPVAVPSLNNKEFTTSAASGYVYVRDDDYTTPAALIAALQGEKLVYRLAEPEEYTYDELNLTERVFAGGMEQAIVSEGEESAPLVADIVYPIDAYNTIKANKAKIEDLQQKPAISLTADEVTKLRALISAATQSEGGEL